MIGIDIALVREQCRILEDETSDELLELYYGAAVRQIERRTGRTIVEEIADDSPENALVFENDVELAVLLLVAHWSKNPGATTSGPLVKTPLAFEMLVEPLRWIEL